MKRSLLIPSLLFVASLIGTAYAQEPVAPAAPATPVPGQPPVGPVGPVGPAAPVAPVQGVGPTRPGKVNTLILMGDYFSGMMSENMLQKVELDAKEMPALDAVKVVLDQIKIPYEIRPEVKTDVKVTMTLKGVPAVYALMLVTREAKLGFAFEQKEGKERILILPISKQPVNRISVSVPDVNVDVRNPVQVSRVAGTVTSSVAVGGVRQPVGPTFYGGQYASGFQAVPLPLPDARVKLDARNISVRDALKKVLEQSKLPYVIEDDVPTELKRSFTFDNLPIATALDVICGSAEIGWRPYVGKDNRLSILVGKRYATQYRLLPPGAGQGTYIYKGPQGAQAASAYTTNKRERRATFTCPNCRHRQTVLLTEDEEGNDDKESRQWRFCPKCGKPVGNRSSVKPEADYHDHQEVAVYVAR